LDDARENVGAPTSQCRKGRLPERYTRYMDLMGKCVVTYPFSFKEAVQQSVWIDSVVEEYDSIIRNSVLDVVPRLEDKLVVSSHWIYKVKQVADGRVEKHKDIFVPVAFHK